MLSCCTSTIPCIILTHTTPQAAHSTLTFEGQQFQGPEAIIGKLQAAGTVSHKVQSTDVQPSVQGSNAIVIFITGQMSIAGNNPLLFCQVFQLVSSGNS